MNSKKGESEVEEARCVNCGKAIEGDDVFCSVKCEREWLRRETSKAAEEGILFCPRCGSTKISLVIPGLIDMWNCKECGYRGPLAVRDGEIRNEIHGRFEKAKRNSQ